MTNEIVQGIAITLHTAFGDSYEIYQNNVLQGLKEPCFFVAVLEPSRMRQIGRRWRQNTPVDIHYFPSVYGDNAELAKTADRLFETMEFIDLPNGDKMHGYDMRAESVDGVLHFFVQYNAYLVQADDTDRMSQLELKSGIAER